jgi:hypothetical protein
VKHFKNPNDALKYHVTGAIERGEAVAIEAVVKTKHTPGPWTVKPSILETYDFVEIGENQIDVFTEGNARLIAAAPEMLEALEHVYRELIDAGESADAVHFRVVGAAIRKAKGETV